MKNLILPAFVAIVASLLTWQVLPNQGGVYGVKAKESVVDKLARTNELRCGYAIATPWMMADPNTGQLSGVNYDFTNAVAQKLGVTVNWVEETGWGVAEQGLRSGRYDMMCGSVCVDPKRTKAATFSKPFLHIPVFAIARADDTRFDNGLEPVDSSDIKIGVKNGHVFEFITDENFPNANKVYANDISDDTEFLLMLSTKKIDIAYAGQSTIDLYLQTNGDVIKPVGQPVRYCNGGFMLPRGDFEFKHMVDTAIDELNAGGALAKSVYAHVENDPRYVQLPQYQHRD